MKSIPVKVQEIISQMKNLGIEIADVSVYPMTKFYRENPRDVVIIAGYLPGKACLMTVDTSIVRSTGETDRATFSINAELGKSCSVDIRNFLSDISRQPVGHESYGWRDFYINTYTESMDDGLDFFNTFLLKKARFLNDVFTNRVHLWYVPEYSDAHQSREKRFGRYNSKIYEPFTKKVLSKLPREIFSEQQFK